MYNNQIEGAMSALIQQIDWMLVYLAVVGSGVHVLVEHSDWNILGEQSDSEPPCTTISLS